MDTEINMTMDIYSHVLPTMQRDAMEKLNQAFILLGSVDKAEKEGLGDDDNEDEDDDGQGSLVLV